jgi:hypothetical protein
VRALNPGLALGRLRVAPKEGAYNRDEILALPDTPADLDPAAGILTQGEGNVLSHVQLLARALGIPYSVEGCPITSATDAMDIQIAREGVPTGVIGIPCRYMHTAIETVAPEDVDRCARVLARFVGDLEPSWRAVEVIK